MSLRLSPNEEQSFYRARAEELRLQRLLEVRRQSKQNELRSLSSFKEQADLSNRLAEVEKRRQELAAKTEELQRLKALRAMAVDSIGVAEREASQRAELLSAKSLIDSLRQQQREEQERDRFKAAIEKDRAVRAVQEIDQQATRERLITRKLLGQSVVEEYRSLHPQPSVSETREVSAILASMAAMQSKRSIMQVEASTGFTNTAPIVVKVTRGEDVPVCQSTPLQPCAPAPTLTAEQHHALKEREKVATVHASAQQKVREVEEELRVMARKDKQGKVAVVLQEQKLLGTGGVEGEPAGMWSKEVWARSLHEKRGKVVAKSEVTTSALPPEAVKLPTPAALSAAIAEFTNVQKKPASSLSELKKAMLAKKRVSGNIPVEVFAKEKPGNFSASLNVEDSDYRVELEKPSDLYFGEYPDSREPPNNDDELLLATSLPAAAPHLTASTESLDNLVDRYAQLMKELGSETPPPPLAKAESLVSEWDFSVPQGRGGQVAKKEEEETRSGANDVKVAKKPRVLSSEEKAEILSRREKAKSFGRTKK